MIPKTTKELAPPQKPIPLNYCPCYGFNEPKSGVMKDRVDDYCPILGMPCKMERAGIIPNIEHCPEAIIADFEERESFAKITESCVCPRELSPLAVPFPSFLKYLRLANIPQPTPE